MEKCMKEAIFRIKKRDLVSLHGRMVRNILGSGKMGNKKEKASMLMNLARLGKEFGVMENLFNEFFFFVY